MARVSHLDMSRESLIRILSWLLAILLGALQAWSARYLISTEDGISYLDLADAYFRGDWDNAINAYWSPLYSWILGLTFSVLHPSPYWEFPFVKGVNFLVYLLAFLAFEFFLSELQDYYSRLTSLSHPPSFPVPAWVWRVLGATLFLWSALHWTTLRSDTPDMSTAALVYLAAGLVLRGQSMAASWGHFMSLGIVLALAYFSKAALFPVAFVFLAVSACAGESLRHALPRALVALLVFVTVSAPWILALSTAKGHFTVSDAGKLSYVWLVHPGSWLITDHHWQGGHAAYGTPTHPTHKIFDAPPAFEFGTPLGGTYPPWYDPSYWYDGLLLQFSLPQQLKIVAKNLLFYYRTCLQSAMFGYLLLLGTGGMWRPSLRGFRVTWPLFLLAGAGLGVYGLGTDLSLAFIEDQPSTRYIAPFLVLLFAGVFASVRLPDTRVSQHVLVGFTTAVVGVTGTTLALHAAKDVTRLLHTKHTHWEIAEGLHSLGVPPGSKVAHLGMKNYYWARVARVKIVAEIPNPEEFWVKSAAVRADVLQAIKQTGAKIIVQRAGVKIPDVALTEGWQKIGETDSYAYLFRMEPW